MKNLVVELVCLLVLSSAAAAAPNAALPADLHVLLGVDPSDAVSGVVLNPTMAPSRTMGGATGSRVTIIETASMAEVMRASRTVENEIIIAPAHVTASALLHAYTLLAVTGEERAFALVVVNGIDQMSQMAGKRIYLPQQDSLRSYVAKGLLLDSGVKLAQLGKVTYGNTSTGGLVALSFGMVDATIADEAQARDWLAKNPGKAHILKSTRAVPGGASLVVRKDLCAALCPKLAAWVSSADGSIPGVGRFRLAPPNARQQFVYIASLGITTPDTVTGVTTVGAQQVADLARTNVTIVDTRSPKEFDTEHIKGAVNLPYLERSLKETDFDVSKDDFSALSKLPNKAAPVVFLCNGPECWKSYKASRVAQNSGFTKVYWFRGGMPEWREKQMPVDGSMSMPLASAAQVLPRPAAKQLH